MKIILVFQVVVAILLTTTILLQSKGTGLGSAWGGSGEFYRTKRGAERFLFGLTIFLATLFIVLSIVNVLA